MVPCTGDIDSEMVPIGPSNPLPVSAGVSANDPDDYKAIAAGSTDSVLGAVGAVGDYLSHIIITPLTDACGAVSIKDGPGGATITLFVGGGTVALPILAPIAVPIGATALAAGWRITTGANVSALAVGKFT
jgi:hypothetical protein